MLLVSTLLVMVAEECDSMESTTCGYTSSGVYYTIYIGYIGLCMYVYS